MNEETRASSSPDADGALHVGQQFAGHIVEAEIGRGGMGVVYRARNIALERERALKVIAPGLSADQGFRERFRRESRLAAQVEHPNVVTVHDAGEDDGRLYIAMRLVDGGNLRHAVEAEGRLPSKRVAKLVADIAAGLDAAHNRGLVHRDVKPSNILIEAGRTGERAFLTDFGISRSVGADTILTSAGAFLGSVDYVAPEQVEGEAVDARADIYALGAVTYFALTGSPPYRRDTDLAKLFAHANAPPPRAREAVEGLPKEVDDVIARAMAKRPDDRYGSAGDLAEDLERAVGGLPLEPRPKVRRAAGEATTQRIGVLPRWGWAAGTALALAAGVTAAIVLIGGSSGTTSGAAGRVVATISAGKALNGLTVTPKAVWVASRGNGKVTATDPQTNELVPPKITVTGSRPSSVATGFRSIWVTDSATDRLFRVNPKKHSIEQTLKVGHGPSDVAVNDRWVWVSNDDDGTVTRIDPSGAEDDRVVPVGSAPRALAAGAGAIWVSNLESRSISRINPAGAVTIGRPISVPGPPGDIAVGAGAVWAVDNFDGTLLKIDPATGNVDTIQVGTKPRGVKVGFKSVWVANGGDATVSRIDPSTEQPIGAPIPVGADPADIAVGDGSVWVANYDDGTVSRIDP